MKTQQISLKSCYQAYQECRRYKRRKPGVLAYEARLLDELLAMRDALNTRRWLPSRSYCFVVTRPKAREIHAALFKDRVVHHWLVPRLEVLFEPVFIHDSYSNRQGKGAHKAVDRLQSFMKKVSGRATSVASGKVPYAPHKEDLKVSNSPGGYYLQLDIKNFFNRINRNSLFQLLRKRVNKSSRQQKITDAEGDTLLYLCYQLLRKHPATHTRYLGGKNRDKVPAYKRLSNAPEQCGLPIGNLTSQFFANVYLNELDQYVKHTLKCKHYVRYVDDFVLLHEDRQQLLQWRSEIECFLQETLKLELKRLESVKPLSQGVDFLGFITRPHYRLVRRRVVQHLRLQLKQFERLCIRQVADEVAAPVSLLHMKVNYKKMMKLQSILASYLGHFKHANSERLVQNIWQEYSWLSLLFERPVGSYRLIPLWNPKAISSFSHQRNFFKHYYLVVLQNCACVGRISDTGTWMYRSREKLEQLPSAIRPVRFIQHLVGWRTLSDLPIDLKRRQREGLLFIQTGWKLLILGSQTKSATKIALPEKAEREKLFQYFRALQIPYVYIVEQGYLRGGLKRRVLRECYGVGSYV